ncbi:MULTISPECIES: abortive infection family protein [unclassified Roseobacter]|uniref:abortive infection family protein n=1 Tax=unclassified Roseobacter TaxID=196798 RepID=UPI001C0E9B13|nr:MULTISPECIES: abortive infection family protein [unclassified Roseobacter]
MRAIDDLFEMADGYALDFSNKTLAEFFEDQFNEDIYADRYASRGNSKANRIRAYLDLATPLQAGKLLRALWSHRNRQREIETQRRNNLIASGFMEVEELEVFLLPFAEDDQAFHELVEAIEKRNDSEIVAAATILAANFNFDTVALEIERARNFVDDDPEDAITAACSLIESVCRSILVELDLPLPKELSVKPLYKAVRGPLGLAPDKPSVETQVAADVRAILAGLSNSIEGIGALRTHAGDAHGREKGRPRVDARIARLSVNTASAIAVFLIETWSRRYPERALPNPGAEVS